MQNILLPTSYLAPISYYSCVVSQNKITLEQHENYIKQTFRNRCSIYAANGKVDLSIPIQKYSNHTIIKDIRIDNNQNWQKLHWRSIASAYGSSPFYIYYDYELLPFFEKKVDFLWDFNEALQTKILEFLKISIHPAFTTSYLSEYPNTIDLRSSTHSKKNELFWPLPSYQQVFQNKYGFISNLSIVDLLFNMGPESKNHLKTVKLIKS